MTGAQLPKLLGSEPDRLVGFRRDGRGWRQVPVQVDERAQIDLRTVRSTTPENRTLTTLAYADPATLAGADPDPALDSDDEVAAMAKDAGARARRSDAPRGVRSRSRSELRIKDPLRPGEKSYLYLFRAKGRLEPSAGRDYVDYEFRLDSGGYPDTYDFNGIGDNGSGLPGNPESSTVSTPFYSQHLLSRWIADELRITAGGASGVDILDGDKVQVAFGCGRSELTFSRGGGGFIANIDGPVRAIRSYIGANSGTFTQRDHIYYARSDVTTTHLRVHAGISKVSQFYDYSAAAVGMTYRNSLNPGGVAIDGNPESIDPGASVWEQVTGPQGSATIVSRVATDLPGFSLSTYYLDDATDPPIPQCGGYADAAAYGSSGPVFTSGGQNTDPTLGAAYFLTGTRTTFYGEPGEGAKVGALRSRQVDAPLAVRVR